MTVPPEPPATPGPPATPTVPPVAATPPPSPPYQYVAPPPGPKTNGLAIASLVCSLATFMFCGVGSILGIVFGHIARHQTKRSGDAGAGMALAGVIIGYVTLALGVVAISAIAIFADTFDGRTEVVNHARDVDVQIVRLARLRSVSPRDGAVIVQAFAGECCEREVTLGSTGVLLRSATTSDLERVGWRLDVDGFSGDHACLTVPDRPFARDRDVRGGRC